MAEKKKTDENFIAFLNKYGVSNEKAINAIADFGVTTLEELREARNAPNLYDELKKKLLEAKLQITCNALDKIEIYAIENAIYFVTNPTAQADAKKLMAFLEKNGVKLAENDKEKILNILINSGVKTLSDLASLKEKGDQDDDLKNLTNKINTLNTGAGSAFAKITATMVNNSINTPQVDNALKEFIKDNRLPPGTENALLESEITSLEKLKTVIEDEAPNGKRAILKKKLEVKGIDPTQFDKIKVADIEHEIAVANEPPTFVPDTKKSKIIADAIKEVDKLREKVAKATNDSFSAIKTQVETEHSALMNKIGDVSGIDFTAAMNAVTASKDELMRLLQETITSSRSAVNLISDAEKVQVSYPDIIRDNRVLFGFLVSPKEIVHSRSALIRMPEKPNQFSHYYPEKSAESKSFTYKGAQVQSFASSCYEQSSSTLATTTNVKGAFFTGSGIAAVSAAASYADAKKATAEEKKFNSSTVSKCGEISYLYIPKKAINIEKDGIQLSDRATKELERIAGILDVNSKKAEIITFFKEFGSHFFQESIFGGRYKFEAKGESSSQTEKSLLISAVNKTNQWAANLSASYASLGGAGQAASGVQGATSVGIASGNRYEARFDYATVTVTTSVLGGAGISTKDVWQETLKYNATWRVIDRNWPIAVWELLSKDPGMDDITKKLAPLMESIWVREIFLEGVKDSYPFLYQYILNNPNISTCSALSTIVEENSQEPEVIIEVISATSREFEEHPTVVTPTPTKKGLKLIGGGAMVDYGNGKGNMLTGSYPEDNYWVASAKSHAEPCLAKVTAYAIYLYDPYDQWQVVRVTNESSGFSNRPEATAILPEGYALTGGGARVTFRGYGIMLTACCPKMNGDSYVGWTAKGKDHYRDHGDSGNATSWAFGIRPTNDIKVTDSNFIHYNERGKMPPILESAVNSKGQVIVGGGASVVWAGDGGLLTCSAPSDDNKKWRAKAKDHLSTDNSLNLSMWVITRQGKTLRNKLIGELNTRTQIPKGGYEPHTDDMLADQMAMLTYYREIGWSDEELKKHLIDNLRNQFIAIIPQTPDIRNPPSQGELQGMNNRALIDSYGESVSKGLTKIFTDRMLRQNLLFDLNTGSKPPEGGYESKTDDWLADQMAMLNYYRFQTKRSNEELKTQAIDGLRNHFIWVVGQVLGPKAPSDLQGLNNRKLIDLYGRTIKGNI